MHYLRSRPRDPFWDELTETEKFVQAVYEVRWYIAEVVETSSEAIADRIVYAYTGEQTEERLHDEASKIMDKYEEARNRTEKQKYYDALTLLAAGVLSRYRSFMPENLAMWAAVILRDTTQPDKNKQEKPRPTTRHRNTNPNAYRNEVIKKLHEDLKEIGIPASRSLKQETDEHYFCTIRCWSAIDVIGVACQSIAGRPLEKPEHDEPISNPIYRVLWLNQEGRHGTSPDTIKYPLKTYMGDLGKGNYETIKSIVYKTKL